MQNNLTAKDLSGISDMMFYEFQATKKCAEMSQSFQDPELIELSSKLASHHFKRYSELLELLGK